MSGHWAGHMNIDWPSIWADLSKSILLLFCHRYYNWQIAGPMLMSYLIFQRPLQQVKSHMFKSHERNLGNTATLVINCFAVNCV